MRERFEPHLVNGPLGDPGLYVDFRDARRALLFDLGDNARLAPRQLLRVSHAFVSHTHMDHFVGLDRFVRIALRRHAGLHCFGPPGFVDQVAYKLAAYTWNLVGIYQPAFVLTASELDAGGRLRSASFSTVHAFAREPLPERPVPDGVLHAEPSFRVRCALLDHRTPCLAFALEEAQRAQVWKPRLRALGLRAGPWLAEAKRAVLEGAPDEQLVVARWRESRRIVERSVRVGELRGDAIRSAPGAKLVYVTDVAHTEDNVRRIVALARGADRLFIEAPFLAADGAHAARKQHLTARQAGEIARASGARSVVPFHFSPRYVGREAELLEEALAAFHGEAQRT
jgi:ribonuclease Z